MVWSPVVYVCAPAVDAATIAKTAIVDGYRCITRGRMSFEIEEIPAETADERQLKTADRRRQWADGRELDCRGVMRVRDAPREAHRTRPYRAAPSSPRWVPSSRESAVCPVPLKRSSSNRALNRVPSTNSATRTRVPLTAQRVTAPAVD